LLKEARAQRPGFALSEAGFRISAGGEDYGNSTNNEATRAIAGLAKFGRCT
jgi:hypothetical protein